MGIKRRRVRWLGEEAQSHFLSDHTKKGGFLGSSVLIAHRPGISDGILYNYYIHRAINLYQAIIFYPQIEPFHLPIQLNAIDIDPDDLLEKRFRKGKIYRLRANSAKEEKPLLDKFYAKLISSKRRKYPFVVVVDTLQKWNSELEEHIRLLIHEAPLSAGSVFIHCPLSVISQDLLSVFSSVMVVWPSQYEISLLNRHFPSEKIPETENNRFDNSKLLVFNSKPVEKRGWSWKKFSPIEPEDTVYLDENDEKEK